MSRDQGFGLAALSKQAVLMVSRGNGDGDCQNIPNRYLKAFLRFSNQGE